jgi:hypothetical protein
MYLTEAVAEDVRAFTGPVRQDQLDHLLNKLGVEHHAGKQTSGGLSQIPNRKRQTYATHGTSKAGEDGSRTISRRR